MAQAPQLAHVTRSALVVDDADRHEQRGLEHGVIEDVEDGGHDGHGGANTNQHRDQTEVTDGRIRQQALEVVLKDGDERTDQQGAHAGSTDQPSPLRGACQRGPQAHEQKHTRLDHGGGMQVRRHGRGRRHRVRQPEVERELCALGQGAERDQDQCR